MIVRILLALTQDSTRSRLTAILDGPNTLVESCQISEGCFARPATDDSDVMVVDVAALGSDQHAAVEQLLDSPRRPDVVVVHEAGSAIDASARARYLAVGCLAILSLDVSDQILRDALGALIERRREAAILAYEQSESWSLGDFTTRSPSMQRFMKTARRLCESDSTLLLLGETGVGKEHLARAIHAASRRASGPFVVLNCGAVPDALLESELFGHELGAFTDAVRERRGHFELAHGGTILLDEIAEMPVHLQVKLLRVLQERRIQRVGGEQAIDVDVRVMAATNRDLGVEMDEKRFRSDLYYRLSVIVLELPPLRERREDIEVLVEEYFERFANQIPSNASGVSRQAMHALTSYSWPGNTRELMNVMERAVLLSEGPEITAEDLPESIAAASPVTRPEVIEKLDASAAEAFDVSWLGMPLGQARRAWNRSFERAYLDALLSSTRGRVGEAATRAGIDPRSLYTKMKRHGLRKEDFRANET